jgi:predicted permease
MRLFSVLADSVFPFAGTSDAASVAMVVSIGMPLSTTGTVLAKRMLAEKVNWDTTRLLSYLLRSGRRPQSVKLLRRRPGWHWRTRLS